MANHFFLNYKLGLENLKVPMKLPLTQIFLNLPLRISTIIFNMYGSAIYLLELTFQNC